MEIIREIRDIESDKIIIKVPKEFRKRRVEIIVLLYEKPGKEDTTAEDPEKKELTSSGLCGVWEDERTPGEIVSDIYSHRTGYYR